MTETRSLSYIFNFKDYKKSLTIDSLLFRNLLPIEENMWNDLTQTFLDPTWLKKDRGEYHPMIIAIKIGILFHKYWLQVLEKGCSTLQVFGDSLLIINWEKQEQCCLTTRLRPFLAEVLRTISTFDNISLLHIYRKTNALVDQLSKEAAQLEYGTWHITEYIENGSFDYHRPFRKGQV